MPSFAKWLLVGAVLAGPLVAGAQVIPEPDEPRTAEAKPVVKSDAKAPAKPPTRARGKPGANGGIALDPFIVTSAVPSPVQFVVPRDPRARKAIDQARDPVAEAAEDARRR